MKMTYTRKSFIDDINKLLEKWKEGEQTIYQSDQMITVCQKLLSIFEMKKQDRDESLDSSPSQKCSESESLGDDLICLQIKVMLKDSKSRNKTYKYKIIKSMDQVQIGDSLSISFEQLREPPNLNTASAEEKIFNALYKEEVTEKIVEFYKGTDMLR